MIFYFKFTEIMEVYKKKMPLQKELEQKKREKGMRAEESAEK